MPTWWTFGHGTGTRSTPSKSQSQPGSPVSTATGMPWTLPEGEVAGVLKSVCASSHSTCSFRPAAPARRAMPLTEPIGSAWSPPMKTGSPSAASAAASTARTQAATAPAERARPGTSTTGAGPGTRLPRSSTARPSAASASSSPAARSASGPMAQPRRPAPASIGTPTSAISSASIRILPRGSMAWIAGGETVFGAAYPAPRNRSRTAHVTRAPLAWPAPAGHPDRTRQRR
jgi:hypothetical protein